MNRSHISSIVQALIAALLFGVSAPLAKLLLGEVEPIPLAANSSAITSNKGYFHDPKL